MPHLINVHTGRQIDRRTLLRGAGVAVALPWLSAMQPASARPNQHSPQRFVAMTLGLGLHADNLVPTGAGRDYQPSIYAKLFQDLRERVTVISGTSHPGVSGGHRAEASILTASPMGTAGLARNTISFDQFLAKHIGPVTRFPALVLSAGGSNSPSYTENGSMVPAISSAAKLFDQLFVDDTEQERARQAERVRQGRSIMDLVAEDARDLQRQLGTADRERLDAYFSSVRELEVRMAESERWAKLPKPAVAEQRPVDVADPNDLVGRQQTMHAVMRLALKTDSTRLLTFHIGGAGGVVPVEGVDEGYHNLSHHGMDELKIEQLTRVESALISGWADFLRDLQNTQEDDTCLLDRTQVLLTSNLGNASNHSNQNMPVLFAGGGFRHGQHLAFDQKKNYPLPNLFVSAMQQMGIEADQFATSTGTMRGLV